ncbi:heavy-metal-associated domain-containing protein [Vibrio sp. JC009]|uniref:HMA2 domain-containing protein n=1 Tax=Vibrio sp. JC009 TaxID=2912314 RepID=UPI0023AFAAA0|nr:cation transporter [Vibrio sp. JC009]WED23905.1 heavy-metal-associated domain-containing protein [Vibrio sp. JC009]
MNKDVKKALKLRSWVHIAHHIPGRVRLKYRLGIIAHLARFNASDIERALDKIPAFRNYKLNSSTGSILIEYDATIVKPALIEELFSEDDAIAEQACYDLADCINLNGVN